MIGYGRVFQSKTLRNVPAFARAFAQAKEKGGGVIPESGCGVGVTSRAEWEWVPVMPEVLPGHCLGTWMGFCPGIWMGLCPGIWMGFCPGIWMGVFPGLWMGFCPGIWMGFFPGTWMGFFLGI